MNALPCNKDRTRKNEPSLPSKVEVCEIGFSRAGAIRRSLSPSCSTLPFIHFHIIFALHVVRICKNVMNESDYFVAVAHDYGSTSIDSLLHTAKVGSQPQDPLSRIPPFHLEKN